MTDQKPNCENCPLPKILHFEDTPYSKGAYVYDCHITGCWMPSEEDGGVIFKCGCLSHPGARAYLMKDVVEELERLSNQNICSQYKYALTEAISLIKNGVEKK